MKKETIYLAGGCFWGTEKYMETVPGVLSTRVGYALGKQKGVEQKVWDTVTYEEVCNHSGHAETVEIVFDADETTLTNILQDFFYTIDPTSLGRQGADIGIQYRTGIYSLTEEQQKVAAEALAELQTKYDRPVVVENLPLLQFIPAEEYHQKYLTKNRLLPYQFCQNRKRKGSLHQSRGLQSHDKGRNAGKPDRNAVQRNPAERHRTSFPERILG